LVYTIDTDMKNWTRWYLAIFFLALFPRIICLIQLDHSIISRMMPLDAGDYAAWGLRIAHGGAPGGEVFYAMPLYAYFLGAIFSIFRDSIGAVRIIQILLGAASVVLIFHIALVVFKDKKTAFIALVLALFFKLSVFYELILESSAVVVFLFLLLILLLISISNKPSPRKFILSGVICSAALLAKANFLIAVPVILLWFVLFFKEVSWRDKFKLSALFILPVILTLTLVTARNYIIGKDLVPITAHSGINFYLGNGPNANGRFPAAPFLVGSSGGMIRQSVLVASQYSGRALKPSEASAYWMRQALQFILENPAWYRGLLANKLKLFASGIEMPDLWSYSFSVKFIPALKYLWLSFFLLIPLGISGIFLIRFRDRKIAILIMLFLGYAVGMISFMVNERYKMPLYPLLILFSAGGIARMISLECSFIRKALAGVVFTALLSISIFDKQFLAVYTVNQAASYNLVGSEFWKKRDYKTATEYFSEAVRLAPDKADYHNSLGAACMNTGDLVKAESEFKNAAAINPNYFIAYQNLVNLLLKQGRNEEAGTYARKYKDTNPL